MCYSVHRIILFIILSIVILFQSRSPNQGVDGLEFYYHDYNELEQILKNINHQYPQLTHLYSIGQSVEGRELWVLEVSAVNISKEEMTPNVKIIGHIHGNEPVGKELILHLIEYLVTNYSSDNFISSLLNTTRIHFLLSMNPDGGEIALESECFHGPGRENHNGTDLNRDFPDLHSGPKDEKNQKIMQPETKAIREWMTQYTFVLSASLHGGALVANYPFENRIDDGNKESKCPDDDVCRHLASTYANTSATMHKGLCQNLPVFSGGITNGAAWYPVEGSMQDYNYLAHGIIEITLELSCCKYPISDELQQFWRDNQKALLTYINEVHRGVRGVILDKITRLPVTGAVLEIKGRNAKFYNDEKGNFWRILLPGRYTIKVEANGYLPYEHKFQVIPTPNQPSSQTATKIKVLLIKSSTKFGNDIGDDEMTDVPPELENSSEISDHKDNSRTPDNEEDDQDPNVVESRELHNGAKPLTINGVCFFLGWLLGPYFAGTLELV